jgi:hypothetical protein
MHILFHSGKQKQRQHLRDKAVNERTILMAKVVVVQAMKAYRKSGSLAPHLLNLGIARR